MNDISKTKLKCPIALKWTIPENRLKELKEEVREIFYSETFDAYNLLDVEYYLSIQNHDGYIWISLHLESSNVRKIETDFCISIESAKYSRKTQQIIEDTNGCSNVRKIDTDFCISIESAKYSRKTQQIIEDTNGWCGYCCTIGELFHSKYNFIVNEKMTIRMDGILSIENDIPKKDEYVINQADILCLDLWKQEKDKNVVIVAEEKEIT
uniref:Uncharacterized protein n=1 Tax=Panagrolaimus sp. ES5 TaxID=591445 RepID=A0AC34G7F3_9BILA